MIWLAISCAWLAGCVVLLAARRAGYHRGKYEVHREFADTFRDLSHATWIRDSKKRELERRRALMNLVLCDPLVRDALRIALADADKDWAA